MTTTLTLARCYALAAHLPAHQPLNVQLGTTAYAGLQVCAEPERIVLVASATPCAAGELTEALRQRLAARGGEVPVVIAAPDGALHRRATVVGMAHGRTWLVCPDARPATVFEQVAQLFGRAA